MDTLAQASLSFREGGSDKVYYARVDKQDDGYIVTFSYGRRGNALTSGQKTPKPVDFLNAMKVFDKLVYEKTSKGYKLDGGTVTGPLTVTKEDTGVRPQLLNEMKKSDLEIYLTDDNWCAQEKFDGRRRMLIRKPGQEDKASNRKGEVVACNQDIMDAFKTSITRDDCVLDGEDMGDKIMIFDAILPVDYQSRYNYLFKLAPIGNKHIDIVKTAWSTTAKRAMLKELQGRNAEGIVFKRIDSPYIPGRPSSGGDQIKYKFCDTASVVVTNINKTKRSIEVSVFSGQALVSVGNVTVYPNQDVPNVGDVVEVKYLYYFKDGSLFQPVLLGVRDDVPSHHCLISKLKLKPETED